MDGGRPHPGRGGDSNLSGSPLRRPINTTSQASGACLGPARVSRPQACTCTSPYSLLHVRQKKPHPYPLSPLTITLSRLAGRYLLPRILPRTANATAQRHSRLMLALHARETLVPQVLDCQRWERGTGTGRGIRSEQKLGFSPNLARSILAGHGTIAHRLSHSLVCFQDAQSAFDTTVWDASSCTLVMDPPWLRQLQPSLYHLHRRLQLSPTSTSGT